MQKATYKKTRYCFAQGTVQKCGSEPGTLIKLHKEILFFKYDLPTSKSFEQKNKKKMGKFCIIIDGYQNNNNCIPTILLKGSIAHYNKRDELTNL